MNQTPNAIEKGKISSFEEGGMKARIQPNNREGYITRPLVIPWFLHFETLGELEVGDEVCFVEFGDFSGVIIARMDNIGGEMFPKSIYIKGDVVTEAGVSHNKHHHPLVEPPIWEEEPWRE